MVFACIFVPTFNALRCIKRHYCRCTGKITALNQETFDESCKDVTQWSCINCAINSINNDTFDNYYVYKLTLDNNNIDDLIWLNELTNLTALSLSYNNLNNLNDRQFINQEQLQELNLRNNNITYVDKDAFKSVNNLKLLYLSNNKIDDLPINLFDDNRSLQTLDLSGNSLTIVKNGTFNNQNELYKLDLHLNEIVTIETGAFDHLKSLIFLHLNYNAIDELPSNLFEFNLNLAVLDLSYNRLRYLKYGIFDKLRNLYQLNLNDNELKELDGKMFKNDNLYKLYLDNNDLYNFDANSLTYSAKKLRYLTLHNNRWDCDYLEEVLNNLNNNKVTVKRGYNYGSMYNVNGIHCDEYVPYEKSYPDDVEEAEEEDEPEENIEHLELENCTIMLDDVNNGGCGGSCYVNLLLIKFNVVTCLFLKYF